jgi:Arc/MetJ-type ribon-helix-helix transcriptional regulator
MQNVAFRLPEEIITRLDRHLERMATQSPGLVLTRSDAVRVLLLKALDEAERLAEDGKKRK